MIFAPGWSHEILTDQYSVTVDIYALVPPSEPKDDRGNPNPPVMQYYARDERADLQPRGGTQRAFQSGTAYESTHVLFVRRLPIVPPAGAKVDVKDEAGNVVRQFEAVFVADWGPHLEIDLKAVQG